MDNEKLYALVERYATWAHTGQTRINGDPYINHPRQVVAAINEGASRPQTQRHSNLVVAAWLHDVIEDTRETIYSMEKFLFGNQELFASAYDIFSVLKMVDSLTIKLPRTNHPLTLNDLSERARFKHLVMMGKLALTPRDALIVKIADRLCNLRDMKTANWSDKKQDFYALEAEDILSIALDRHAIEDYNWLALMLKEEIVRVQNRFSVH